jgi:hypothetical protein
MNYSLYIIVLKYFFLLFENEYHVTFFKIKLHLQIFFIEKT